MTLRSILSAVVGAVLSLSPAYATLADPPALLYDNGPTSFAYGIEMSAYQEAEDFVLPAPATLTGAKFWTIEGYGIRQTTLPFDGHVDYWLYPSVGGAPGATAIASGVGQAVARVDRGLQTKNYGQLEGYETSFDFESPVALPAGQPYFLALHVLATYPDANHHGEYYWATTDAPSYFAPSHGRYQQTGPWNDNSQSVPGVYGAGHLAFQVYGTVPEPTHIGLLMLLPALTRHRRCRTRARAHG
jgi:hypothetical protein